MPRKLTTQEFISKAKLVHGDKYDYSLVEYTGAHNKIIIICPTHTTFLITPSNHLANRGCCECRNDSLRESFSSNNQEFIQKSKIIHNNKYNYSKVEYKHSHSKIIIICPIHGDFLQTPSNHLTGYGCIDCFHEQHNGLYQISKALIGHYNFSGYLYIIKMYNNEESFIKIGVTKNINNRFKLIKSQSKYIIEVIKTQFFDDFNQAIIKENELHENYKEHSCLPPNLF